MEVHREVGWRGGGERDEGRGIERRRVEGRRVEGWRRKPILICVVSVALLGAQNGDRSCEHHMIYMYMSHDCMHMHALIVCINIVCIFT